MQTIFSSNEIWKLCTLANFFLSCFIILFCLNHKQYGVNDLLAFRKEALIRAPPLSSLVPSHSMLVGEQEDTTPPMEAQILPMWVGEREEDRIPPMEAQIAPIWVGERPREDTTPPMEAQIAPMMWDGERDDTTPREAPMMWVEEREDRNPAVYPPSLENITLTITPLNSSSMSNVEFPKPLSLIGNGKPLINQTTTQVKCDIFNGKWVYKPNENPPYNKFRCPFLSDQVSCQRNGRPDSQYQNWYWEAKDCEIPRFNGIDMLERLRGKRVIIVGDSLNRNQWESFACLLYSAIPSSRACVVNVRSSVYKVFKAKDYNCSVEFYWSPFLVQLNTSPRGTKVLRLDKLAASARQWRGADIMVFDTGHWWVHTGKLKAWDLFQYRREFVKEMEIEKALEMGMKTWARWVDRNVDSAKTTVVFRSISPEHKAKHWCYNVTQPIMDESYVSFFPKPVTDVIERTIRRMRTPVKYLNITKLSQYRRDGHPTVYKTKDGKELIERQEKQPQTFADCSHWCLPGVPDTWNRLLYPLIGAISK